MELRINLATASLKDAEHLIFIVGAYFGMTNLPQVGERASLATHVHVGHVGEYRVSLPQTVGDDPRHDHAQAINAAHTHSMNDPSATHSFAQPDPNPSTVFATPAALPPEAGEAPMTADPATVFAGNGATAPAGLPVSPAALPSAQPAAAPAAGDAGNVAGAVAAPAGSPLPAMPAPGPSPSGAPAGVELDTDGLPWDGRINASGDKGDKPKNKDGRWRSKRGLNDGALVARVQAELRATMAATGAVAPPTTPYPQPPVAQVPTPPPVAQVPTPPAVMPPPPAATGSLAAPTTLEQLMPRVTKAVTDNVMPRNALQDACVAYGLPNIIALSQRPDLLPSVWTLLQGTYPGLA